MSTALRTLRLLSAENHQRPTWWCVATIALILAIVPLCSRAATSRGPTHTTMLPPTEPACVSSPFGPRILPNRPLAGTFHNGIDLPAPVGAPVTAVAAGTVIRIQRHGIGGLEVLIQHNGFVGIYSHLGLVVPALAEGRKVIYGGERIGTIGRTGLSYGPHLYFGMLVAGNPVDPAPYLRVQPCGAEPRPVRDSRLRPTRLYAVSD